MIDLSELEFIDSSGIGALVRLEERTRTAGLEIVFTRPTTAVGKIPAPSGWLVDSGSPTKSPNGDAPSANCR